jgi:sugar phosphate isomerase/epimerase
VSLTYHAPFRDWNLGSFNDHSAAASVEQVKATLDAASVAGAGAVTVHGGSVPERYPNWVREEGHQTAIDSLRACAEYAATVGVPLCLENQPPHPRRRRYTTTPEALEETIDAVGIGPEALRVTLDVGHARVSGTDWQTYVDRFGDRIEVCHLHCNDGTADLHDPLPEYRRYVEEVDATYNVFEMKSVRDIERCVVSDGQQVDS